MQGEAGLIFDLAVSHIWANAKQPCLRGLYETMYFCKVKASCLFLLLFIFNWAIYLCCLGRQTTRTQFDTRGCIWFSSMFKEPNVIPTEEMILSQYWGVTFISLYFFAYLHVQYKYIMPPCQYVFKTLWTPNHSKWLGENGPICEICPMLTFALSR